MNIRQNNILPLLVVLVILPVSQGSLPIIAQSQKPQDQLWEEQRYGITVGCTIQNPFKEFNERIGEPVEEIDEDIATCNHDMLYLLGVCKQNNDAYSFCKSVNSYIEDNNLGQIEEKPDQLSQETIDNINEYDWNGDGVTDGSDFMDKRQ